MNPKRLCLFAAAGAIGSLSLSPSTLAQHAFDDLAVIRSPIDARAGFVTAPDRVSALRAPGGEIITSPEMFLRERGEIFGVQDAASELVLAKSARDNIGWMSTTFHQVHRGVRVFSGVLKVNQNAAGEVIAANGDFYPIPDSLDVLPLITSDEAYERAVFTIRNGQRELVELDVVVVDPAWYGDPPAGVRLAYYLVVEDLDVAYSYSFFIDAHTGELLDRWSQIHRAKDRQIHDGMGAGSLPGTLARAEGAGPTGDFDIDAAYDYYGDTYDYFSRAFGRDSIDDSGLSMIATAHSTAPSCPNAFWSSGLLQMVFCDGTVTDDVVGHELMHGVTAFESGLIYQNQSGQLNESYSDVFGELIDLFNGDAAFVGPPGGTPWPTHATGEGLDIPNSLRTACSPATGYPDGVRWLVGEDAFAFGGAIRDMWEPPCDADPDYANSPLQICNLFDSGGVHSGSGVPNHAFAILTDGKSFNGVVTTGIGPIKAGAVWYRAQTNYLTVGSDFLEAYWALNQAAADLVGTDPNDPRTGLPSGAPFTAFDATQVDNALRAVEMDSAGLCGHSEELLSSDPAPSCGPTTLVYAEDFESGAPGWTTFNSAPPSPYDWALAGSLPFLRTGTAFFCPNDPPAPSGSDESATHTLESPPIVLPVGGFCVLSFDHFMQSERRWDGGLVRVRINGGAPVTVPAEAYFHNAPNTVLLSASEGNTNPFAGDAAFAGFGGEWGTSLVSLGSIAPGGATIQLQFEFSKDQNSGEVGWYVDDVAVFTCDVATDCNSNGVPDSIDNANAGTPLNFWDKAPALGNAFWSDADVPDGETDPQVLAAQVRIPVAQTIESLRLWGIYSPDDSPPAPDFTIIIHDLDPGNLHLPGPVIHTESGVSASRTVTGRIADGFPEYEITLTLATPVVVGPGAFWIEVFDDTTGDTDSFEWIGSRYSRGFWDLAFTRSSVPGTSWLRALTSQMSLELIGPPLVAQCDGDADANGVVDVSDISFVIFRLGNTGPSCTPGDVDGNGIVDINDIAYVIFRLGTCNPGCPCI